MAQNYFCQLISRWLVTSTTQNCNNSLEDETKIISSWIKWKKKKKKKKGGGSLKQQTCAGRHLNLRVNYLKSLWTKKKSVNVNVTNNNRCFCFHYEESRSPSNEPPQKLISLKIFLAVNGKGQIISFTHLKSTNIICLIQVTIQSYLFKLRKS